MALYGRDEPKINVGAQCGLAAVRTHVNDGSLEKLRPREVATQVTQLCVLAMSSKRRTFIAEVSCLDRQALYLVVEARIGTRVDMRRWERGNIGHAGPVSPVGARKAALAVLVSARVRKVAHWRARMSTGAG